MKESVIVNSSLLRRNKTAVNKVALQMVTETEQTIRQKAADQDATRN